MRIMLPNFILRVERWKWNKEYRVYVSTLGNFKDEHKNNIPVKINQKGYVYVKTSYGLKAAHRLVMFTWKPIPNAESLTVDHLNHNKRDNSIYNLEWVSREENLKRAEADLVVASDLAFRIIRFGKKHSFNTMTEAIAFVHKKNGGMGADEVIEKRIINAIDNKKEYCGGKWRYEN